MDHGISLAAPCEPVPTIDFTDTVHYSNGSDDGLYPDGTTVRIECDWRYALVPPASATRTCVSGSWTGQQPRCRHVPRLCQRNDYIVENYGMVCQTRCSRSYNPCRGNNKCVCDGACGWSCIAIDRDDYCPEIDPREGTSVQYSPPGRRRYRDRAIFDCVADYHYLSGSAVKICAADGVWEGEDLVCRPEHVCADLPTVENASPWQTGRPFSIPGNTQSYSCVRGFAIYGERTITCLANYTWSRPQLTCSPKSCGHPGEIPNAAIGSNNFLYRSEVHYICNEGYEHAPFTARFRTCLSNQRWSSRIPSCQPVQCPAIESIEHGTVTGSHYEFRSWLRFQCNEGFRLVGSQTRTCQADATWSGREAVCREIICESPTAPANGIIRRGGGQATYRHNDVIHYACNQDYVLAGSASNYCQDNDQWAHPTPMCVIPCLEFPVLNGEIRIRSRSNDGLTQSAEVWCSGGYTRRLDTMQCSNGIWSDGDSIESPLCRPNPCFVRHLQSPPPLSITFEPNIPNDVLSTRMVPHDTEIVYTCQRGYKISRSNDRSKRVTCNLGNLDPRVTPTCEPVLCPMTETANARTIYREERNGQAVQGSRRKIICYRGYRHRDSRSSFWWSCDDGQWVNGGSHAVYCEPKPCAAVNKSSGHLDSVSYTRDPVNGDLEYPHGTTVMVQCPQHYTLPSGNGTYQCSASEWTPIMPVCLSSPNKAIGSTATQSTRPGIRGTAKKAVDGRTSGYDVDYSCAKTGILQNPWWRTEMNSNYRVVSVKIYNRLDSGHRNHNNLTGAEIRIGNNPVSTHNPRCGNPISWSADYASTSKNHGILISCAGQALIGKYVSVQIRTEGGPSRHLTLCEVEVFGDPVIVDDNAGEDVTGNPLSACTVLSIRKARPINSTVWIGQPVITNSTISYRCHDGYTTDVDQFDDGPASVHLTCLENRTWSPPVTRCFPKSCNSSFLQLEHSHLGQNESVLVKHNHAIDFTCDTGYRKKSTRPVRCLRGRFNRISLTCDPVGCNSESLNLPDAMNPSEDHFQHDSMLIVNCESGYELLHLLNDSLPVCQHGEWIGNVSSTCQKVMCPVPGSARFGTLQEVNVTGVEGYFHGARIRYQCEGNRLLEGNEFRDCVHGEWTGEVPSCLIPVPYRPQPCVLPPADNNERYSIQGRGAFHIYGDGAPHGSRLDIAVSCDAYHNAQPSVRTECQDGNWTEPVPRCVPIERTCEKPHSALRVFQYIGGDETRELFDYPHESLPEGTVLFSRCSLPGQFSLQGSAVRTCSEGQWSGVEPTCERTTAKMSIHSFGDPVEVRSDGAVVIYTRWNTRVEMDCTVEAGGAVSWIDSEHGWDRPRKWRFFYTTVFSRAVFNPPYRADSGHFTCRALDNSVSHSVLVEFAAIHCSRPGEPLHGQWHDDDIDSWKHGIYPMTKQIRYSCDENYNLVGVNRITCILGTWSHPTPTCELMNCPELQSPLHGDVIGGKQGSVGDGAVFFCHEGFQLIGERDVECLSTLEWSHSAPVCQEIVVPPSPCDFVTCKVWEKCVITGSAASCNCISPANCPPASGPEVCGTDGRNYTSLCWLKAAACLLGTGVEVAASSDACLQEITQPQETFSATEPAPSQNEGGSSSWSLAGPEVANSGGQENEVAPTSGGQGSAATPPVGGQGSTVVSELLPTAGGGEPSSVRDLCPASRCAMKTLADACVNVSSAVIVYTNLENLSADILWGQVYAVLYTGEETWEEGSWMGIRIDTTAVAGQGCHCSSPLATGPRHYIVIFSQPRNPDGTMTLGEADYVQPHSNDLPAEVRRYCRTGTTGFPTTTTTTTTTTFKTTISTETPQEQPALQEDSVSSYSNYWQPSELGPETTTDPSTSNSGSYQSSESYGSIL